MQKLSFSARLIDLAAVPSTAVGRVLSKIKGTTVPIVQNLLPSQTQKEGVRGGQGASRFGAIFQTAGIGALYGLLFAGLLLMPFQSH